MPFSLTGTAKTNVILDCIENSTGSGAQSRIGGPDSCEVKPHSKPWTVRIAGSCGGTLIAKNVVLTAKHCPGLNKGNVVFLGDHSKKDFDKGEREIKIEKVYDLKECPTCDYALLILSEAVYICVNTDYF